MSRTYTKSEVALHNTPEDLWIVVHGKVYDTTQFQNEHPGGKQILRSVAGKDATRAFKKYHHDRILSYRSTRDLVVGRVDHSLKTAMEQRGSMFGKLFDWAWRRGDTGLGAEVKNTETVAPATIEPQAEATKSKVEDV